MTPPPPAGAPATTRATTPVPKTSRKSKDRPTADYRSPGTAAAEPPEWTPLPPMKPHRKLFFALLLAWAAWCGVMIALYFTTVRPHVQPTQPPPASAPAMA